METPSTTKIEVGGHLDRLLPGATILVDGLERRTPARRAPGR